MAFKEVCDFCGEFINEGRLNVLKSSMLITELLTVTVRLKEVSVDVEDPEEVSLCTDCFRARVKSGDVSFMR